MSKLRMQRSFDVDITSVHMFPCCLDMLHHICNLFLQQMYSRMNWCTERLLLQRNAVRQDL